MCKQVYLVGPSATSVSHVQRGAHRHLVCMRDESCAVSARSCRHQVLLRLHASSGHPGQHAPRRDPQSSGGGSEAARRRPGGRGAAASVSRESSLGHGKKGGFRKGPESAFKRTTGYPSQHPPDARELTAHSDRRATHPSPISNRTGRGRSYALPLFLAHLAAFLFTWPRPYGLRKCAWCALPSAAARPRPRRALASRGQAPPPGRARG